MKACFDEVCLNCDDRGLNIYIGKELVGFIQGRKWVSCVKGALGLLWSFRGEYDVPNEVISLLDWLNKRLWLVEVLNDWYAWMANVHSLCDVIAGLREGVFRKYASMDDFLDAVKEFRLGMFHVGSVVSGEVDSRAFVSGSLTPEQVASLVEEEARGKGLRVFFNLGAVVNTLWKVMGYGVRILKCGVFENGEIAGFYVLVSAPTGRYGDRREFWVLAWKWGKWTVR